jgi:hypothetical protein
MYEDEDDGGYVVCVLWCCSEDLQTGSTLSALRFASRATRVITTKVSRYVL